MASVLIFNSDNSLKADIDYAIPDGRVRQFLLNGVMLYDEDKNIALNNWEATLYKLIKKQGFDVDNGMGLKAFVYPLLDKYDSWSIN